MLAHKLVVGLPSAGVSSSWTTSACGSRRSHRIRQRKLVRSTYRRVHAAQPDGHQRFAKTSTRRSSTRRSERDDGQQDARPHQPDRALVVGAGNAGVTGRRTSSILSGAAPHGGGAFSGKTRRRWTLALHGATSRRTWSRPAWRRSAWCSSHAMAWLSRLGRQDQRHWHVPTRRSASWCARTSPTPRGIINRSSAPSIARAAAFGRTEPEFTRERTDKSALRADGGPAKAEGKAEGSFFNTVVDAGCGARSQRLLFQMLRWRSPRQPDGLGATV